jgi:hypothetical protein
LPEVYRSRIDQLKQKTTAVLLETAVSTSGKMSVKVDITNLSTSALGNARLYAVVYEDLNTGENHYVVRDITPVQTVTMPGHSTASFELKSNINHNTNRHLVVILKSTGGTILQSSFVI